MYSHFTIIRYKKVNLYKRWYKAIDFYQSHQSSTDLLRTERIKMASLFKSYWLPKDPSSNSYRFRRNGSSLVHYLIYSYLSWKIYSCFFTFIVLPFLKTLKIFTFSCMLVNVWPCSKRCFSTLDCSGSYMILKSFYEISIWPMLQLTQSLKLILYIEPRW